jgi:hypothetical protein
MMKESMVATVADELIYWGCELCGHEVPQADKACWECETGKYLCWLDWNGNKK